MFLEDRLTNLISCITNVISCVTNPIFYVTCQPPKREFTLRCQAPDGTRHNTLMAQDTTIFVSEHILCGVFVSEHILCGVRLLTAQHATHNTQHFFSEILCLVSDCVTQKIIFVSRFKRIASFRCFMFRYFMFKDCVARLSLSKNQLAVLFFLFRGTERTYSIEWTHYSHFVCHFP